MVLFKLIYHYNKIDLEIWILVRIDLNVTFLRQSIQRVYLQYAKIDQNSLIVCRYVHIN